MALTNWVVVILFSLGLYTLLTNSDLIKMVIALNIMEASVILLLVRLAYFPGARAPIIVEASEKVADPIPQALALTAIVIGASTTALLLSFVIKIHGQSGTIDLDEIERN